MKILLLFIASWVIGLCAYVGSSALFYRQTIWFTSADFRWAALSSFLGFAVTFCVVYLPALLALRRLLRGVRPVWPFPVVAALLGALPTALVLFYWGGTCRSILRPEALLFYALFGAAGIIVGIGFACICRHDNVA